MRKYTKKSCHTKKSEAKKVQKRMHNSGQTARIVKTQVTVSGKKKVKYCVETAGKKKR
jgi:hypothetical protein